MPDIALSREKLDVRATEQQGRKELRQYLERLYGLDVDSVYKSVNYDGALRRVKKQMKHRFWTDIYDG